MELGAGVGLPSLALLFRGVDVLATDYYPEALDYARRNAAHNGLPSLATRLVDWRSPPADLPRAPLVLLADVLYEQRNADILLQLLPDLVEAKGRILLSDPGRVYLRPFLESAADRGWRVGALGEREQPSPAGGDIRIRIRLFELVPPSGPDPSAEPSTG
jgi:ribosomal protein L11 methylase PrmA